MVEWDGLENRCGACLHRGFESHPLRSLRSLRGQAPLRSLNTGPSPNGEGFFVYTIIVNNLMMKVDGQVSRGGRDKCPEDPYLNKVVRVYTNRGTFTERI